MPVDLEFTFVVYDVCNVIQVKGQGGGDFYSDLYTAKRLVGK